MRFSPGSVRLVAGRTNALGQMEPANYFPVGTIDNTQTLVVNRIDDFLFASVSEDRAIDFAFLVEREGLLGKGGGSPAPAAPAAGAAPGTSAAAAAASALATVEPGVFIELNRMGQFDLSGATLSPASQYKVDKTVEVLRPIPEQRQEAPPPEQPPAPAPQAAPAVPLKDKLVGTWTGKATNGADLSLTFNADGSVAYTVGGNPGTGSWSSQGEVNPTTLNITRKLGENPEETTSIVFGGDDSIALTNAAGATTNLTRKK
jgi:hypothetical protein